MTSLDYDADLYGCYLQEPNDKINFLKNTLKTILEITLLYSWIWDFCLGFSTVGFGISISVFSTEGGLRVTYFIALTIVQILLNFLRSLGWLSLLHAKYRNETKKT